MTVKSLKNAIDPTVRHETWRVGIFTVAGTILMWLVFVILHAILPNRIPLDYTVFLGGACGAVVGVLNFFLMGITVQNAVDKPSEDEQEAQMRISYTLRTVLEAAWVVIAISAPCFQLVAGIVPVLIPTIAVRLMQIPARQSGSK